MRVAYSKIYATTSKFFRYVKKIPLTEQLKADNQMLWVRKMNNIRNRAQEIVNAELIHT
jgi:hypothetical protein